MIRNSSRVVALAIAAALTLAPAVSACSAGAEPETSSPSRLTEGVNVATESGVSVRNLFVLGPATGQRLVPGASAPVYASVINNSTDGQPDRLVAVGSPVFQQPAQPVGGGIELPVGQLVRLDTQSATRSGPPVVLGGLTRQLLGGESIELTLRFQRGGDVNVLVPVVPQADAYATYSPAATPTPSASATPGAPATPSPGTSGAATSPNSSATPKTPRTSSGASASPSPSTTQG